MRTNLTLALGLVAALSCSHAAAQVTGKKTTADGKSNAVDAQAALRFPLPQRTPYLAKIDSVTKEGTVQASLLENNPSLPAEFRVDLSEGYYVAVVKESQGNVLDGARLFRAVVTDIGENGTAQFQIAKAAADKLKAGEFLMLFRPSGATTTQLKQLPDIAPLEAGPLQGSSR